MKSILSLILKSEDELLPWINTIHDYCEGVKSIPVKLLIAMEPYASDLFNHHDSYWRLVADCSDPMLTKFIRKHQHHIIHHMTNNTNPALADLIIKYCNETNESCFSNPNVGLTDYIINSPESVIDYVDLSRNKNPMLTEFIIASYEKLNKQLLCWNENPALVELIMLEPHWEKISENPNTGLTEIIINNPDKVDYNRLSYNTNRKLIPFMHTHAAKLNTLVLISNRAMLRKRSYDF